MAKTDLAQVQGQVQEFWSPLFMKELREDLLLGALVNKDYEGQIKKGGDTVYVSQINAPEGQLKTIGVDADSFDSSLLSTSRIAIVADKRAVESFEFEDVVDLQSQIETRGEEIREALRFSIAKQINDYLYSLVAPSAAAPAHDLSTVTAMDAAQVAALRLLAAKAKWRKEKGWWLLCDPSYYNDILQAQTLTSSDYVGEEKAVVGGQIVNKRYGFNILEDNSRPTDYALAFHPDFLHLVMQMEPRFKVSDLHAQKKFGAVMSVDVIFGAKLGIDGDVKHIRVQN